jgi:hypothetical protein
LIRTNQQNHFTKFQRTQQVLHSKQVMYLKYGGIPGQLKNVCKTIFEDYLQANLKVSFDNAAVTAFITKPLLNLYFEMNTEICENNTKTFRTAYAT